MGGGGGGVIIAFFVGTVRGLKLYKNLGEQQRKANAYREKRIKGEF